MAGQFVKDDRNDHKLNEDDEEFGKFNDFPFVSFTDTAGENELRSNPNKEEKRKTTLDSGSSISLDPQVNDHQSSELSNHQHQVLDDQEAVDPKLNPNKEEICTSTLKEELLIPMLMIPMVVLNQQVTATAPLLGHHDIPGVGGNAEDRDIASSSLAPTKRKANGNCKSKKRTKTCEYEKPPYMNDKEAEARRQACIRSHTARERKKEKLKAEEETNAKLKEELEMKNTTIAELQAERDAEKEMNTELRETLVQYLTIMAEQESRILELLKGK